MITPRIYLQSGILGIISGFSIMVTSSTLNFWLVKSNISLNSLGLFSLACLPYAINFLWAAPLDQYYYQSPSKRNYLIILLQTLAATLILILSQLNPNENIEWIFLITFFISLLFSTNDSILGSLRAELVKPSQQGEISGSYMLGYRLGMILSSSGAIYLSSLYTWSIIYKFLALICFMFNFLIILHSKLNMLDKLPSEHMQIETKSSLFQNFLNSFSRYSAKELVIVLGFLILYRLPDNYINILINPFLIENGYNEAEIAWNCKFLGIISVIIGGLYASRIMKKISIRYGLILFGILHACAHGLFILQLAAKKNIFLMSFIIIGESFTGGMAMSCYIAFIASLCEGKYKATQYALFSSMMGISRSIFPLLSGYIVTLTGWNNFFILMMLCAMIPILFLKKISMNQKV